MFPKMQSLENTRPLEQSPVRCAQVLAFFLKKKPNTPCQLQHTGGWIKIWGCFAGTTAKQVQKLQDQGSH